MNKPGLKKKRGAMSVESDDPAALRRQIEELTSRLELLEANGPRARRRNAKVAESRSVRMGGVHTAGGTAISGDVKVESGDFIGRDAITVIERLIVTGADAGQAKMNVAAYLDALARDLSGVRLGDIDAGADHRRQAPLELQDIYIPIDTTFKRPIHIDLREAIALSPKEIRERAETPEAQELIFTRISKAMAEEDISAIALRQLESHQFDSEDTSALEALCAFPRLTLLGAPGSGKSTFGAFVLLALARAWQGQVTTRDVFGKAWTSGNLLPVRVVLRQFAEMFASGESVPNAGDIWTFIGRDLQARGWTDAQSGMPFIQNLVRSVGGLVFFDGLDECGDDRRRHRVLNAVQAFIGAASEKTRFLITARPYAYPDGPRPSDGIFEIAQLDDSKIEQFVNRWYAAIAGNRWALRDLPERMRDDLLVAYKRPELRLLAGNPLLLTLMAVLHSNRGRLPDDRADLYGETVDLLLRRWNRDVGADRALLTQLSVPGLSMRDIQAALEKLAYAVHQTAEGTSGPADIPQMSLLRAFQPLAQGSFDKAEAVVAFIERRAGLLIGQGAALGQDPKFTFPHRTFQEYLAAQYLKDQRDLSATARQLAKRSPAHWREVLTLAARLAGPDRGGAAADETIRAADPPVRGVLKNLDESCWSRVILAARMLKEIGPVQLQQLNTSKAVLQRILRWLTFGISCWQKGGPRARMRAEMGDLLSSLGDPRFDSSLYHHCVDDPMLGFLWIDCLPDLAMARYLVTVDQYNDFLRDTNKANSPALLRDPGSRPARSICKSEAHQYARWLEGKLRSAPELKDTDAAALVRDKGWIVDLPTGPEWLQSARAGVERRPYPWGQQFETERANTIEAEIADTSAVGCFAPNDFGLYDMAGNVLEWTSDQMPENDQAYAVRGGAYDRGHRQARCEEYGFTNSNTRAAMLGFRLVLRNPKPPKSRSVRSRRNPSERPLKRPRTAR